MSGYSHHVNRDGHNYVDWSKGDGYGRFRHEVPKACTMLFWSTGGTVGPHKPSDPLPGYGERA